MPVKNWPDVARFFARVFKYIREIIWKVSDFSQEIQQRIELEKPIDDLINGATDEFFNTSTVKKSKIKKANKPSRKK